MTQHVNIALSIRAKCDDVYASHADMRAVSFKYTEVFSNRKRQHSTLGHRSPVQFLAHWIGRQHQEKLVA